MPATPSENPNGSVSIPPPEPKELSSALKRNIQALEERRAREERDASLEARIADRITAFAGSMRFVYLHLAGYGLWILWNLGIVPDAAPFDPTFVVLAMAASVEAIFLSTFVLISQNRMAAVADKRADLDLHIDLLAEHELTKLTELVAKIAERLDAAGDIPRELEDVERDVAPEAVLDEIETQQEAQMNGMKG